MAPLNILNWLDSTPLLYTLHFVIGIFFGLILEQSGFGDSRILAAQFYLKKMTVLKVMFMAIITASCLIFLSSGLGLMDYTHIWVNPTYLLPGVIGGVVMGIGFVIGGYCPGTSLVSMATLKIDGLFFVIGCLLGVAVFGETIDATFVNWWSADSVSRFTLPSWLDLPLGWVVLLEVLLAIGFFKGAEWLEQRFGGKHEAKLPLWGVLSLILAAGLIIIIGQPDDKARWQTVSPKYGPILERGEESIHPAELVELWYNDRLDVKIWDIRSESAFNHFHLKDSEHRNNSQLTEPQLVAMRYLAPNIVHILVGDKSHNAQDLWKTMKAYNIPNVYVLEGGLDNWAKVFRKHTEPGAPHIPKANWNGYLGDRSPLANPEPEWIEHMEYPKKVKLQLIKQVAQGGCG